MKVKKIVVLLTMSAMVVGGATACSSLFNKTSDTKAESSSSQAMDETEALTKVEDYGTVKLGQYKGVKLTVESTEVTDAEVEQQIESLLLNNPSRTEVTDRSAEIGDVVNINYVGKRDGVEFDGGSSDNYDLKLGSNNFIPGFEEGLVGLNKGDNKTLELTFPKEYHSAELAGAAVTFDVVINAIYAETPAVLNDEWVTSITGGTHNTVEEYRTFLKNNLIDAKKNSAEQGAQQQALNIVMESSEYTPNQAAIDYEFKNIVNQYKTMANSSGQTYADFVKAYYNMSTDEIEAELKTYGEQIVKQKLVIEEIFKQEKMSLTDDDYARLTELYGMDKESLIKEYGQDDIDYSAKTYKVIKFIVDNAEKTVMETESVTSEPTMESMEESASTEESMANEESSQVEESTEETSAAQ